MWSFHIQTVESPLGYCLSPFSNFILLSSPSVTIQWAYQTFWFLHTDALQPQACPCCSLASIVLSLTLHLPVISPSRLPLKYHFLRGPPWTTHLKYNSCYCFIISTSFTFTPRHWPPLVHLLGVFSVSLIGLPTHGVGYHVHFFLHLPGYTSTSHGTW